MMRAVLCGWFGGDRSAIWVVTRGQDLAGSLRCVTTWTMTSAASQRRSAELRAKELEDTIREIGSHLSLRAIAAALNRRDIPTGRGGQWHATSVRRVMQRCGMPIGVALDVRCAMVGVQDQVDLVVTSPPYAMQRSGQYGGIDEDLYPKWTVAWLAALRPRLSSRGSVAIVISPHVRRGVLSDVMLKTRLLVREAGWHECGEFVWTKPSAPPLGHSGRPRRSWESVLWFAPSRKPFCNPFHEQKLSARVGWVGGKGRGSYRRTSSDSIRDGLARCRDVIEVAAGGGNGTDHPATYPVALAEWLIKLLSPLGGVVLDPFGGSGSTALAALRTGRRCISGDISPDFVKASQERVGRVAGRLFPNDPKC